MYNIRLIIVVCGGGGLKKKFLMFSILKVPLVYS